MTPHCELCGAAWAEVWIRDGVRLTLCRSCINEIDAVDLGAVHDEDLEPEEYRMCRYCFATVMNCQDGGCECPRCGYTESA